MFEETNQTQSLVSDGSDMFLDEQTSETGEENEQEEMEAEGESADEQEESDYQTEGPDNEKETADNKKDDSANKQNSADQSAQKEPTIRVKYNGEEKNIPMSEATILAQKGMNYDKIARERDELRNSKEMRELDLWAKQSGMTRQEFVALLAAQREEALLQTALQEVQGEYGELSEKAARELAKARAAQKRQENESTAAQAQADEEAEKLKPWSEFVERYPNIKEAKDLPQTVIDEMASGQPPVEAMQRYELAELKKQLAELNKKNAADRKNDDNKQKSLGSAASMGAETRPDAFFAGFES